MEKMLKQLPAEDQAELQGIVAKLVQQFQPEKIICFGCISSKKDSYSCFAEATDESCNHYFLLVVTAAGKRIEHDVQSYATNHFKKGKVTVLAHRHETIEKALSRQSRFFCRAFREGALLYVASGFVTMPALPDVCPRKAAEKAITHFYNRFDLAQGFFCAAENALENGYFNCAVFLMHQVVEQSCRALIRVHMAYRSDIHHLGRLLDLCCCFSPEPARVFAGNTPEDTRLFSILAKSYLEGRYKDEFQVDEADARQLYRKVKYFMELTRDLCFKEIEVLEAKALLTEAQMEEAQIKSDSEELIRTV
ncbi:HEPN domain-containing protein [Pontibacter sp. Tf4]|uniref:HEPN domain-containing protein n=1 Tax=Pontibacter sp. Tf4 TaxID=2761620 RepID=UPI0016252C9C|nr:HEPN domain-containing protein [Pontibacter sp. Tf4]MBB6611538.1 HEPN domain-containing protein [Pontibacter sp. Tf4]